MKRILKNIFKSIGYKISNINKILLLDEDPFVAIKKKLTRNDVIFFDVGANQGQTINKIIQHYPDAKIYAFEPSKNCFNVLKEKNNATNVSIHNVAMGSSCGTLEFNEYSWSQLNSFLNRAYGSAKIVETYLVEVATVDDFCKKNEISAINLLKTDTEGYELNVLKGAAAMMEQNKIQFVYVEIFFNDNYFGQASFGDIYNFLLEHRFELVRFYDVLHTEDGLASKADALFINKSFMN